MEVDFSGPLDEVNCFSGEMQRAQARGQRAWFLSNTAEKKSKTESKN